MKANNVNNNKNDQNNSRNGKGRNRGKGKPRYNGRPDRPTTDRERSGRDYDADAKLDSRGRDNDPNWYFVSSEIATQAAELSFQDMLGTGVVVGDYPAPTVFVQFLNPSPGITVNPGEKGPESYTGDSHLPLAANVDYNDGVNLMANELYTLLARKSGRAQNYAPQDVTTLLLALGEFASISEHIRRAFGVMMTYNTRNRAIPPRLIAAMGFAFSDIAANLSDYRMRFNTIIARMNQIPLLDNIGYIRKCREIYQHVYTDEVSNMAQLFITRPYSTWQLDEQSYEQGTVLKTINLPTSGSSMNQWFDILENMLSVLLNSSTLNIIYSDIWNMADSMNIPMWQFDYLNENYVVMPEYNRTAINQFHNSDFYGAPMRLTPGSENPYVEYGGIKFTGNNDVIPDVDNNRIIYNPLFYLNTVGQSVAPNHAMFHDVIIDMDSDTPTLEDRVEALRFSIAISAWWVKHLGVYATAFPTLSDHYPVQLQVYWRDNGSDSPIVVDRNTTKIANLTDTGDHFKILSALSQFENAPYLYGWAGSSDDPAYENISAIIGDLTFFTSVEWKYLDKVNRIMNTGLWKFRM